MGITLSSLKVMAKLIAGLELNEEKMKEAMTKELYATEEAYKLVENGTPFRDAYEEVSKKFM
ncbi:MAG: hypothetical protein GY852_06685 [bacterium]|nr:hypothetical protein [bacterium]